MSDKFVKTIRQKEAVDLLGSLARHICLFGGARSGKSIIILYAIIIRACKTKSRHCILRLNFNAVKRTIWMETLPALLNMAFPDLQVSYNKTDYILNFPNGSTILFGGLDDGSRVEKILGHEFSTVWFNEISQIDYESVQIVLSRLAEKNNLSKKIYYDMNPNSKADWPYLVFKKKINPVDNEPLKDPENYSSLLMTPADNIQNLDHEYLALLNSMPERERNRFLLGLFSDNTSGISYYSFSREKHVKPVQPQYGTIFIGSDFNITPMCSIVGQYLDGTFYIFDEIYLENSDTYKLTDEIIKRGYKGVRIIPDSTAANRKTSGKSDLQILKEAGFHIESTRNPFVMDRVNNVNRLFTANRIVIDPKCRKLINDLERVSWKNNKLFPGEDGMLGHISDALGYFLWKLDPIGFSKGSVRQEKTR